MSVGRNRTRFAAVGAVVALCAAVGCQSGSGNQSRDRARSASERQSARTRSESGTGQRVVTGAAQMRRVELAAAQRGPAAGKRSQQLQPAALFYGALPTVFTFTPDDQMFVCFPRWSDPVQFTVATVRDGRLVPFPDAKLNQFDPADPRKFDPTTHLVSVQSVVADERGRVWIIDTGSINMAPPIPGGPKVWVYDPKSGRRVKDFRFGADVIKEKTYLNDVRIDFAHGSEGYAFITDSGAGGIIVIDIASGQSWRRLDGHPSVKPSPNFVPQVEGQPLMRRPQNAPPQPIDIAADGVALSPDGQTLYYTPLSSRDLYSVSVDALVDREQTREQVAQTVKRVTQKRSANDGLVCDGLGRIYSTDFEDNAVRRYDPSTGEWDVIVQDERLLWPDCVWIHKGDLYVTANQLHRQASFQNGQDVRQEPYVMFRIPIDAASAAEQRKASAPGNVPSDVPRQDTGTTPAGTRPPVEPGPASR